MKAIELKKALEKIDDNTEIAVTITYSNFRLTAEHFGNLINDVPNERIIIRFIQDKHRI